MNRRRGKEPQGQPSTGSREARDPRFDKIMETLWEFGHIMGMQAQERTAAYTQATKAATIAGNRHKCGFLFLDSSQQNRVTKIVCRWTVRKSSPKAKRISA